MWVHAERFQQIYQSSISSYKPQISSRSTNADNISVQDLVVESFEEKLKKSIESGVSEWEELDDKNISKTKSKQKVGSRFLALPAGMNIWEFDDDDIQHFTHERIPASNQASYFRSLKGIFHTIPRESEHSKRLAPSLHTEKLKLQLDSSLTLAKEVNYLQTEQPTKRTRNNKRIQANELVYTCSIHNSRRKTENKQQEMLILGSNTLLDLSQAIYCLNGKENDSNSSFFIVEGKFYTNSDGNNAIIDKIQQWQCNLASNSLVEGRNDVLSMKSQKLNDLKLRIGVRYLFCHAGFCEHFIYFSDARLFHNEIDDPVIENYPLLTFNSRMKMRKCAVCEIWSAKYVIYGDRLAEENPTFQCDICFEMLHCDKAGTLLYDDFTAFEYKHDMD